MLPFYLIVRNALNIIFCQLTETKLPYFYVFEIFNTLLKGNSKTEIIKIFNVVKLL